MSGPTELARNEPIGLIDERAASEGLLLALLGQYAMRRLRETHIEHKLSPRQFHLLGLLHDRGPTGQRELATLMDIDRSALVFPFTHIGGVVWLFTSLLTGCRLIVVEAFDPATTIPILAREGVTLAGAGTPFHMAYLAE